ncbi:DUF2007 domain-containing protein [Methylobrevis pamukkalensis]|uniref:DUF2007 domain-containing protein n=1 Tax=Methylobrevis pamukkalensis TaxID=1439726 RepID=A0A1E3GZZ5_9HYPH|nr:DUF2007 domain-containing protein [Methylobrevis pamukkalensis]ODN68901.1 hypothetical protein A6302_03800 [Methylobrevis pamukkalensis]
MKELMRTNDVVALSFACSLLSEAEILHFVADEAASVMDGSVSMVQRRLMVDSAEAAEARQILTDAGLSAELREEKGTTA